MNNERVITLLVDIPSVRTAFEQTGAHRNQYGGFAPAQRRDHAHAYVNQTYRDRESSMRGMTAFEQRRMQKAIDRYADVVRNRGNRNIFEELKARLVKEYSRSPASVPAQLLQGHRPTADLVLPMQWTDFKGIRAGLVSRQRTVALHAYYANKYHTAWRYLCNPNPWMDPNAQYVEGDSVSGRYSSFEFYIDHINICYLGVTDKDDEPTDGHTLQSRFDHFVTELALLGRAHNWDTSRPRADGRGVEEFDDMCGDKPSCYSGVQRRLNQSVAGHSLFRWVSFRLYTYICICMCMCMCKCLANSSS
jgi:hypothetical protein